MIVGGNDDAVFAINSASGEITINDNSKLDFETIQSHTLFTSVSDGTNTSISEDVLVDINDVNDNFPEVGVNQVYSVNENSINGTLVGTVLATDADAGTTFSNWNIFGGTDADGIFSIDETSGEVKIANHTYLSEVVIC